MPESDKNSTTSKHKSIETASKAKNPLESFPEFKKFCNESDGFEANLYCKSKVDMDSKTIKWAFKLAEQNVGPFYKNCNLGWQPKIKQADLNKSWARYLVAEDVRKRPIAYAMFRFDFDYGHSVLYCYEIQIEKEFRRKGLGKFMMNALEKCASHWNMEKVVLTVLKNNEEALDFFVKLGFTVDETSPDDSEGFDYKILSKILS